MEGPRSIRRGSHAERRAATRLRVFAAATDNIFRQGYAALTTTLAAEQAGVSRGALQQQFPTKDALVVGLIEHLAEVIDAPRTARLVEIPAGIERWLALPDVVWSDSDSPAAIAFLEIQVAARSHPSLAERIRPVAMALKRRRHDLIYAIAQAAGIADRDAVEAIVEHDTAAMNGFVIELMFTGDRASVQRGYERMKQLCQASAATLIAASQEIDNQA